MRFFAPRLSQVGRSFLCFSLPLSRRWSLDIAAGKCFQLTRSSGSLIFTFNFQEIPLIYFRLPGCLGLDSENRPRHSRFGYAQARRIRSLRGQIVFLELLGIYEQISNARRRFRWKCFWISSVRVFDDWLSASRQWRVKDIEITLYSKVYFQPEAMFEIAGDS